MLNQEPTNSPKWKLSIEETTRVVNGTLKRLHKPAVMSGIAIRNLLKLKSEILITKATTPEKIKNLSGVMSSIIKFGRHVITCLGRRKYNAKKVTRKTVRAMRILFDNLLYSVKQ